MIYAQNYWQCFNSGYWVNQGLNWSDIVIELTEQAEAIEIAVARAIYRKTANPDNPDYSLWWVAIRQTYYARENAGIVVEEENERDWPLWVELRRTLWKFCDGSNWLRSEDCPHESDDHLWDCAIERVAHKLLNGSFAYAEETSEGIRQYQASLQ
jgi:hypothetical protein